VFLHTTLARGALHGASWALGGPNYSKYVHALNHHQKKPPQLWERNLQNWGDNRFQYFLPVSAGPTKMHITPGKEETVCGEWDASTRLPHPPQFPEIISSI
jgi:hypothetical protein